MIRSRAQTERPDTPHRVSLFRQTFQLYSCQAIIGNLDGILSEDGVQVKFFVGFFGHRIFSVSKKKLKDCGCGGFMRFRRT